MTTERVLRVGGEVISPGTSLFNSTTGEVYWFKAVEDGAVYLEAVEDATRLPVDEFRRAVQEGDLVVEASVPEPNEVGNDRRGQHPERMVGCRARGDHSVTFPTCVRATPPTDARYRSFRGAYRCVSGPPSTDDIEMLGSLVIRANRRNPDGLRYTRRVR